MFTIFLGKKKVCNLKEALEIDTELFVRFFQTLFNEGIYIPPSPHEAWFISQAHKESHLIRTREVILDFMEKAF